MLWILALPALAGSSNATDCLSCCRTAGLTTCSTELLVHGEASKTYKEGAGWRSEGLYVIACDGRGFFDDGRTSVFSSAPGWGDAVKQSSAQWACFAQACQLPNNLCFDADTGKVTVCSTGAGPTAAAFRAAPAPKASPGTSSGGSATATWTTPPAPAPSATRTTTVLVGGRALTVTRAPAQTEPASATVTAAAPPDATSPDATSPDATSPGATAPVTTPRPKNYGLFDDLDDDQILSILESGSSPELQAPAPAPYVPAISPAPAETPAQAAKPDAVAQLITGLPKDPPTTCTPPLDALRSEARKQVMAGDDLRMARDASGAVQKYRAALSMDSCNGYAWLGLGQAAVVLGRPDLSIRLLANATTLMPSHYGAWTDLGSAYEAIRQVDLAVSAYRRAVALKPGLDGAMAGLTRLGAL